MKIKTLTNQLNPKSYPELSSVGRAEDQIVHLDILMSLVRIRQVGP